MNDECTTWLDECGVMTETLQVSFLCAIDIEVVGVGRRDNAHPGTQPMERTVEFIGFDNDIVRIGQNVVGTVVLRDTTKEGVTVG